MKFYCELELLKAKMISVPIVWFWVTPTARACIWGYSFSNSLPTCHLRSRLYFLWVLKLFKRLPIHLVLVAYSLPTNIAVLKRALSSSVRSECVISWARYVLYINTRTDLIICLGYQLAFISKVLDKVLDYVKVYGWFTELHCNSTN